MASWMEGMCNLTTRLYRGVVKQFYEGNSIDAIYLDYAKVFDSVPKGMGLKVIFLVRLQASFSTENNK